MIATRRCFLPVLATTFLVLPGCAPATAAGQESPPTPPPNVYEVGPEQLKALMAVADSQPGTLEVTGSAQVSVATDRARIDFAVETESESAREAAAENARRMDAVIRALREAGGQGLTVETHGYQLTPRYRVPDRNRPRAREIEGYTALNLVQAASGDVTAVGRLIDAAVDAGANRVASLTFEASDPTEARLEALRMAVGKARSEAETIAASMGVRLGRPLSVKGGARLPEPRMLRAMAMAEAVQTPVEPGDQTVTAQVTITYALEAGGR